MLAGTNYTTARQIQFSHFGEATEKSRRNKLTNPIIAQTSPYEVLLKEGQKYAWCKCGLSAKQPFCDGAHKQTEDLKPIVFNVAKEEKVYLCGCKQTNDGPYCDGTHNTL